MQYMQYISLSIQNLHRLSWFRRQLDRFSSMYTLATYYIQTLYSHKTTESVACSNLLRLPEPQLLCRAATGTCSSNTWKTRPLSVTKSAETQLYPIDSSAPSNPPGDTDLLDGLSSPGYAERGPSWQKAACLLNQETVVHRRSWGLGIESRRAESCCVKRLAMIYDCDFMRRLDAACSLAEA